MSYIEKKYKNKIDEIFDTLSKLDSDILEQLNHKSISNVDNIAKLCATCNKQINQILKKYYPEIKELDDKLKIKSTLKFYYDLIDKLTDFVKNVETFQKLDNQYYESIIKFLKEKEKLISGKYTDICTQELTSFYDKKTRENLEKVIAEKIEKKEREFFGIGPLEQEIKKIGKHAGAESIYITRSQEGDRNLLDTAASVITYSHGITKEQIEKVGIVLENFLKSKNFKVINKFGFILTDAKLLSDEN